MGKNSDGVICDLGKNPETGNSIAAENRGSLVDCRLLAVDYRLLLLTTDH
jgi:hypothetical protein